jgi:O-acetyl-ADP-ribose deacetylase (regulator of RNase III)
MITYKTGNLLNAPVEALVNTVNTVGVMGKGIALQFKKAFPEVFSAYREAVKQGEIVVGQVQVVPIRALQGPRYVINFPTKQHWRSPSQLAWIETGLVDLKKKLETLNIQSVALPPLGCGNGQLKWAEVKALIEKIMMDSTIDIQVYEPSETIKEILKKEDTAKNQKLTPARAMLLTMLYKYRALGEEASEFAAEKLSYFLQRFGETQLKLHFTEGYYGPYSGKVRHVLYALNGSYLRGFEQKQAKPFESLELVVDNRPLLDTYVNESLPPDQKNRLQKVMAFIEGFESPYGLELLATVDFAIQQTGSTNTTNVTKYVSSWSTRKAQTFSQQHIQMAIAHLSQYLTSSSSN